MKLSLLFTLLIFSILFLPHADTDFGWHYRCGDKILRNHSICAQNEFSYFLKDYKWANPTFLYDALIAFTYNLGGFLGVSIIGAIISASIIILIYKLMGSVPQLLRIILILAAIGLSWSTLRLGFRSQHLTLLFLIATLAILLKNLKTFHKSFYILPLLFFVWANTHAGFFLGPVLIFFFIIRAAYEILLRRREVKYGTNILAVSLTSISATLINPFGYRVYAEVYHHWQTPLNRLIAEWVAPHTWQIMLIITLSGFLILKEFTSEKPNVFIVLLTLLITYTAITARRNLPIFYLTYIVLATYKADTFRIRSTLTAYESLNDILLLFLFSSFLFIGVINIQKTIAFSTDWNKYCNSGYQRYPCEATKYFKGKVGNIYNTYEWGGFLIWQLPDMKVFADGRMPAWIGENGKSPYTTWLEILQTQEGWNEKLDKYNTDYLLISKGTFLDLLLQEDAPKYKYKEVYRDEQAVIYEKVE